LIIFIFIISKFLDEENSARENWITKNLFALSCHCSLLPLRFGLKEENNNLEDYLPNLQNSRVCCTCKSDIVISSPEILVFHTQKSVPRKNNFFYIPNSIQFQNESYCLFSVCYFESYDSLGAHYYNVSKVGDNYYSFDDDTVKINSIDFNDDAKIIYYFKEHGEEREICIYFFPQIIFYLFLF
jgi:hypothetical protein